MKIKKGYILLLLIAAIWYGMHRYNQKQKLLEIEKKAQTLMAKIIHQDIYEIQESLDNNLSQYISLDKIMRFCQSINLDKINLKVTSYKEFNNSLLINGKLLDKNQTIPFYLTIKENNTTKIKELKIGNNSLTSYNFAFPIVAK